MSTTLSQRAYARHRADLGMSGTTHRAVQKAIEDGRIAAALVRDVRGKVLGINPEIADREWASQTLGNANASTEQLSQAAALAHKARGSNMTSKGEKAVAAAQQRITAPPAPDNEPPLSGGSSASYASARAIKEGYEARLKKLEYDEKSGKLIPADRVKSDCFKAGAVVREALLNMPARLGAELASLTDAFEIERVLRQEVHAVLKMVSSEFARAAGIANE
jgi:hypothetical protein